jgi:hypothetical protein
MLQCLPSQHIESLEIPIGMDADTGGEISFSLQQGNFQTGIIPVLNDKLLSTNFAFTSEGDVYTTTVNDNTKGFGRFTLSFSNVTEVDDILKQQITFSAWISNHQLIISGEINGKANATIYDVNGRKLSVHKLNNKNRNELEMPVKNAGLFFVKIEDAAQSKVLKVIQTGR